MPAISVERRGVEPPTVGVQSRCSPVELPSRARPGWSRGGYLVVPSGEGVTIPGRPQGPSCFLAIVSSSRENRKGPEGPGESSRTIQSRSGVGRLRLTTEIEGSRPASRRCAPRSGRWRRGSIAGHTPTHPASRHYSVVVQGRERPTARALGGEGRIRTFGPLAGPGREDRCLGPLGHPTCARPRQPLMHRGQRRLEGASRIDGAAPLLGGYR